jgi:outer membrane lipoprotein-sorting protein
MSISLPLPSPDDPIDRAAEAVRRTPIPEGPSEQTIARTLAALRAADDAPAIVPLRRRRIMLSILKAAGVILATAGGLLYFASFPPASATTEFTEVARKLHDAHTLSFRQTTKITGQEAQTAQISYMVPGLVRSEGEPVGGPVSIMDMTHGKTLILNPADKSALLLEEPPAEGRPRKLDLAASMIEYMRGLAQKEGEPAGEKVLGDVHARGFRVKEQGQDMTVWIDLQKRLPLLVEVTGRALGLEFRIAFADIRLDPKFDESLFSLDPPAGYAVRKAGAKLFMTPEEAVVRMLRSYAENTGGSFPSRIDDFNAFKQAFSKTKAKKVFEAEVLENAAAAGIIGAFTQAMNDRYGYKANGVKLGDATSIIFWYKPAGQTTYRVVYGDLHMGDVAADKLPEKPKF